MKFSSIHQCLNIFHIHVVSKYGIRSFGQWVTYKVFRNCFDMKEQQVQLCVARPYGKRS